MSGIQIGMCQFWGGDPPPRIISTPFRSIFAVKTFFSALKTYGKRSPCAKRPLDTASWTRGMAFGRDLFLTLTPQFSSQGGGCTPVDLRSFVRETPSGVHFLRRLRRGFVIFKNGGVPTPPKMPFRGVPQK